MLRPHILTGRSIQGIHYKQDCESIRPHFEWLHFNFSEGHQLGGGGLGS
jgi:hypothetical protein